jgi:hypothetical protein
MGSLLVKKGAQRDRDNGARKFVGIKLGRPQPDAGEAVSAGKPQF